MFASPPSTRPSTARPTAKSLLCVLAAMLGVFAAMLFASPCQAGDVTAITSWTTGTSGPSRFTSGTDRLLIFCAGMEDTSNLTISSVSYGGRTMTQVVQTSMGGSVKYGRGYIFYLKDADISAASSNTFSVSWSGGTPADTQYAARMYENVNQSDPIRDQDSAYTNSSTPNPISTPSLTVAAGDLVVAAADCGSAHSYYWNNSFVEGTDQAASSSQLSTADRAITANGSVSASATYNDSVIQQLIVAATLKNNDVVLPTTYYVRPDGSNSNSGTGSSAGSAWRTVAHAASSSLNPGDVICVMPGTYVGAIATSVDGTSSLPIRFVPDTDGNVFGTAGDVVLKATAGNEVVDLDSADYLEFYSFHIEGTDDPGGSQQAVELDSCTGVVFENCRIYDADSHGVDVSGSTLKMINCIIHDHDNDGIYAFNSSNVTLWHCISAHNGGDGMQLDSGTCTVVNCIGAYNGDDGFDRNGGTFSHSYNIAYGNGDLDLEGSYPGTGETAVNPLFVDAAARDYQLLGGSPAIGSATVLADVDQDHDGVHRPVGANPDIGPYEYPLLGNWEFNDGSGSTATDTSGNGNHGSLVGGTWETAKCSYAVSLDGTTEWVNLGTLELGTKSFSASFWFKTSRKSQQTLLAATANSDTSKHVMFVELDSSGKVQFIFRSPAATTGGTTLQSTDNYADGVWHHVAALKSTSKLSLYVDGELVDEATNTDSVESSVRVALGRYSTTTGLNYLAGSLDDVTIYGKALTAEEVADLLGIVGRWKLNETSGAVAADSSPLGHHGTYVSGVTLGESGPKSGLIAATFDGNNDYVDLPDIDADFSEGFSISVWALPTSTNYWSRFLDIGRGESQDNILFARYETSSTLSLTIHDGSLAETQRLNQTNAIVNDQWHHYAATVDASGEGKLYIDGVEVASGTIGIPSDVIRDSNFIGRSNWSIDGYYAGQMHDVRLYRKTLCADEIDNIYKGGNSQGIRILKWVEIK